MKEEETGYSFPLIDAFENQDWDRIVAITATVFLLFFYTRSCPFYAGTYWDLLTARDFIQGSPWILSPEKITFLIAQSSISLFGLKAIFHTIFFVICGLLSLLIFRGEEVLPGICVLGIFAFGLQPLIGLRQMLVMLFFTVVIILFDTGKFRNAWGIELAPLAAISAVLGLPTWLLFVYVFFHVALRKNYSISLLFFVFLGTLLFFDNSLGALLGTFSLGENFPHPENVQLLSLLAGIFLIPNILTLPLVEYRQVPNLLFFTVCGFASLIFPGFTPLFILTGTIILLRSLSTIKPLSLNITIIVVIFLIIFIHLFLLLSPSGFRLNPTVRGQLGENLNSLLAGKVRSQPIRPCEIGEVSWKGLLTLVDEDILGLHRYPRLWLVENSGKFSISTQKPSLASGDLDLPDN